MKYEKTDIRKDAVTFSIAIAVIIIIFGASLSYFMYSVIQKSFFKTTVEHEEELMLIMESLGSQLVDCRLQDLKSKTEGTAERYAEALVKGSEDEKIEVLSSIKLGSNRLNYCYQTNNKLYIGEQFNGAFASVLNLSEAWAGETVLFSPDFDADGNYILAVAVPVRNERQEIEGVLIEQLDGYCISKWISDLFLFLDLGTAYIVDGEGRNIATAREENYDWITTRYNAQELLKESSDEATKSIARLEKYALDGKTGIDTYIWEGSTNHVAYGPLTEADWGFYVGFYGDEFYKYTQKITNISAKAAGVMLIAFMIFSGAIIAVVMRNLNKERKYNEILLQQKTEIEQQAYCIVASEERFRIAMKRSRDIILEYQFETGEITCFYEDKEIKSGCVGDASLKESMIDKYCVDEDSYNRFEEVMRGISKGLTSAECIISCNYGEGRKWYSMSVSAVPNGTQMSTRAVGILRDITGEREAEMDSLTRLLNKSAMTRNVTASMHKNRSETVSAFIMLDVDNFKMVNDQYGHPVGDQVLCAIADSITKCFPESYLISRFGGDEFSIYCQSNADVQELKGRLNQLLKNVKSIQAADHKNPDISLSVGAVIFKGRAKFEEIYKKADELLYIVKEAGRDGYRIIEL